ncbi:MAG TPA: PsbP-related protein [Bacillales bacterium]|nr:PsbP-related protein [Bacillales bacterium]
MRNIPGFLFCSCRHNIPFLIAISILIIQINQLVVDNNSKALGLFHDKQEQTMLSYQNNEFDFKIDYPGNWERSVKINNEIVFVSPKEKDSVSNPAGLIIKVVPLQSKNVSVGTLSNALTNELKKDYNDFKLESTSNLMVDGKNAKQIIFTATDSKFQNRKAFQIITTDNTNVFIFTYKASVDKYSQYESTVKDMISTFKFLSK